MDKKTQPGITISAQQVVAGFKTLESVQQGLITTLEQTQKQFSALNETLRLTNAGLKDSAKESELTKPRSQSGQDVESRWEKQKQEALDALPGVSDKAMEVMISTADNALRSSMNNEASYINVANNLDFGEQGLLSEEAKELRHALNALAVEMAGAKHGDVLNIAKLGANGGIAKQDLEVFTRDTIMTAQAWGMTKEESAQKGIALRTSMGYEGGEVGQKQFMQMANMINEVNKNSGIAEKDLIDVMIKAAPRLSNSGFTEQEALSLANSLLLAGANKDDAARSAEDIASALNLGSLASDDQVAAFEKLGMDATSVSTAMKTDAMGTLVKVLEGIKGLNKQDQFATVKTLFGANSPLAANASVPYIESLLDDPTRLIETKNQAENANPDSVTKEYAASADTKQADMERSLDAFNNLSIVVGDKIWPAFSGILNAITDVTIATTQWIAESEGAASAILGFGGAILGGLAAYKAYRRVKFIGTLAGIAKEALGMKKQPSAIDGASNAACTQCDDVDRPEKASSRRVNQSGDQVRTRSNPKTRQPRSRPRNKLKPRILSFATSAASFLADKAKGVPSLISNGAKKVAQTTHTIRDKLKDKRVNPLPKKLLAFGPLKMGLRAIDIGTSLAQGDTASAVESGGGLLGGMGGAAAGAALGTMILPGVGTIVGATIGGMLGDSAGSDIASSLFDWFSKDDLPNKSEEIQAAQIQKAEQAQKPNVTFSPVVQVTGSEQPEKTAALTMDAIQQALAQFAREHGLDSDNLTQDFEHSLVN